MHNFLTLLLITILTACSSSSGDGTPQIGDAACTNDGQKQFVLDNMRIWYFWNDLLPAQVDIGQFASPEDLLSFLSTFSPADANGNPIDRFSFINTAAADAQFFGEGKFEGFGFSSKFVDVDGADLRLTRVFTDSPADQAGLERGQQILRLNGRTIAEINAAEGLGAVFATAPLEFMMRPVVGVDFTVTIAHDIVTIIPIPQWRTIPNSITGVPVGYLELATFISTADPVFDTVFAAFRTAGVNDVIIDLRYNGGGLVSTADLLGDYLGGDVAENLVFSHTLFNADRADNNFTEFFGRLGNSVSLSRLVIVATGGTASASELVTNSMEPHVEVTIVGDTTFGKPVGQIGIEFCEKILRPTAFQTVNANNFGDYFDGLPVDCPAADDLNIAVGLDTDPNMVAALAYLDSGACPVMAVPSEQAKLEVAAPIPQLDRRGPPSREFADAF